MKNEKCKMKAMGRFRTVAKKTAAKLLLLLLSTSWYPSAPQFSE